jgi:hypothetical protein
MAEFLIWILLLAMSRTKRFQRLLAWVVYETGPLGLGPRGDPPSFPKPWYPRWFMRALENALQEADKELFAATRKAFGIEKEQADASE